MPGSSRARTLMAVIALGGTLALVSAGCGGSNAGSGTGMMQAGPGMMGYVPGGGGEPVGSVAAARRQADRFGEALGLHAGEVMQFTNGYYAELLDSAGRKATEVLIAPSSGAVWIEYGPAMMWNTRYGMMSGYSLRRGQGMMGGGGMMGGSGMRGWGMMGGGFRGESGMGGWGMMGGGFRGDPTWTPSRTGAATISPVRARTIANRWLTENADGLTAGEADRFPGYFTLHTLRAGKVTGMLSVNASTGAVWYHWWHGRFLGMAD